MAKVDPTRCVLVKESAIFEAQFDLRRDPRAGGCPDYALNTNKVKIVLFCSSDEYRRVQDASPQELHVSLIANEAIGSQHNVEQNYPRTKREVGTESRGPMSQKK